MKQLEKLSGGLCLKKPEQTFSGTHSVRQKMCVTTVFFRRVSFNDELMKKLRTDFQGGQTKSGLAEVGTGICPNGRFVNQQRRR